MDNNILMEQYVDEVPLDVQMSLLKVDGDQWVIARKYPFDSIYYFYCMTPEGLKVSTKAHQASTFPSAVEAFHFYKKAVEVEEEE